MFWYYLEDKTILRCRKVNVSIDSGLEAFWVVSNVVYEKHVPVTTSKPKLI
jgi:hypothetical protein